MEIEIGKIVVGQRFRSVSAGKVAELVESISECEYFRVDGEKCEVWDND
jgi:hypothetical protein